MPHTKSIAGKDPYTICIQKENLRRRPRRQWWKKYWGRAKECLQEEQIFVKCQDSPGATATVILILDCPAVVSSRDSYDSTQGTQEEENR